MGFIVEVLFKVKPDFIKILTVIDKRNPFFPGNFCYLIVGAHIIIGNDIRRNHKNQSCIVLFRQGNDFAQILFRLFSKPVVFLLINFGPLLRPHIPVRRKSLEALLLFPVPEEIIKILLPQIIVPAVVDRKGRKIGRNFSRLRAD